MDEQRVCSSGGSDDLLVLLSSRLLWVAGSGRSSVSFDRSTGTGSCAVACGERYGIAIANFEHRKSER